MKICLTKSKWYPKSEVNVLNLNDRVNILDLLKGNMSLMEVGWHYGKNELNICSALCIPSIHGFSLAVVSLEPTPMDTKGFPYFG
jgi:hypothetical protein